MGHARSTGFRRISGGARRLTAWTVGPRSGQIQSATAAGLQLAAVGSQAVDSGLTIVRIRGEFVAWLESVGSIGDGFVEWALGLAIINENASGIGATAVPDPLTDVSWGGWMYHSARGPLMGFSVTESENTGPVSQVRLSIDTKAMRKFKETDVLMMAVSWGAEIGAATVSWGFNSRVLVKLP